MTDNSTFEKRQKSIFYGIEFSNGIRRAITVALALIYFLSFDFPLVKITTLFAISGLIAIVFEFLTGPMADHVSRKLSILISMILMGVAFFGLFMSEQFFTLAAFYILQDIAWTFQSGSNTAWIIDALNYGKQKFKLVNLFSRVYFFEKFGRVIGGLIGFFIVAVSFRSIWLVISVLNIIMFIVVIIYMKEKNFKKDTTDKNLIIKTFLKIKQTFVFILHSKNKQALGLFESMFLTTLFGASFYTIAPLVFKNTFNLSPSYISGLFTLAGILFLAGPIIGEKIAIRFGIRKSFLWSFIIIAIGVLIFAYTHSLIVAAISFAVLETLAIGTDVLFDSAIHHRIDSKIRASMGGIMSLFWNLANSLAIFLSGIGVITIGIIPTLTISAILAILSGLGYWITLKGE